MYSAASIFEDIFTVSLSNLGRVYWRQLSKLEIVVLVPQEQSVILWMSLSSFEQSCKCPYIILGTKGQWYLQLDTEQGSWGQWHGLGSMLTLGADQHSLFAVRRAILLLTRQVMNSQIEKQQTTYTHKATGEHSYQDNMGSYT